MVGEEEEDGRQVEVGIGIWVVRLGLPMIYKRRQRTH
jgi:hypothetical protein